MTITPTTLTRAAGLAAVVAGALFIGVQINHPHVDANLVTTTEWSVRQSMKVLMSVLALVGITGMYLRQVQRTAVLGLVGFVLCGIGYLLMLSMEVIGLVVVPSVVQTSPDYVNDVLAVATGGTATGDIGLLMPLNLLAGAGYVLGGLVFGIALFRANILARWASALLAVGTVATLAIPLLPQVNQRLFAIPDGVALIGLGYSLWRDQRTSAPRTTSRPAGTHLDAVGAK